MTGPNAAPTEKIVGGYNYYRNTCSNINLTSLL